MVLFAAFRLLSCHPSVTIPSC